MPSYSATAIAHKGAKVSKIVAIWQHNKRVLGSFFTAHAQKRLFRNFRSKIWPATSISYKTDAFPLPSDVYWIYSMFCATTSHDLVTFTFDLLTLRVSHVQYLSCPSHTNFYYPTTIGYWVTSTEYLITFPLSEKQSLRMRRFTWPVHRRSPKTTRNKFLTPNCLFTIQLLWVYDDD